MPDNIVGRFVSTSIDDAQHLVDITPNPDSIRPKRKRNRPTVSCLCCKRKKIKCDRLKPMCGACLRNHMPDGSCVYVSHLPSIYAAEILEKQSIESEKGSSRSDSSDSFGDTSRLSPFMDTTDTLTNNINTSVSPKSEGEPKSFNPHNKRKRKTNPIMKAPISPTDYDDDPGFDKDTRIESLLNEIDRLRSALFRFDSDWLRPQVFNDIRAKDIYILRGIRKAHLRPLSHLSDRCLRFDKPNSSSFRGPSSFKSLLMCDANLGRLIRDVQGNLECERRAWRKSIHTRQYHDAMNLTLQTTSAKISLQVGSPTTARQIAIIRMLEDYLVDFDLFMRLTKNSFSVMKSFLPVTPKALMDDIISRRFQRVPGSNRIKIILSGFPSDFAEIALVISSLKFGFTTIIANKSSKEFSQTHPSNGIEDNHFSIYSEDKTNLLYFFATNLLEEAEYRTFATLPTLLTLIILFFIALRNVEKYDFVTFDNIPTFQSTTIQMAIVLGFHRGKSESTSVIQVEDGSAPPHCRRLINLLSTDDWHSIWCAVMYLDTMGSFNLGIPSMMNQTVDRCYETGNFNPDIRYIIGAYRTVLRLITEPTPDKSRRTDLIDRQYDPSSPTLFQLEKVILNIEMYNNNRMASFNKLMNQMHTTENQDEMPGIIFSLLLKLRISALLLFLYVHSYLVFRDSNNDLIRMGRMFGKSLDEVKELETRLFRRALKFAILMLGLLNHILLNDFYQNVHALGVFSTDLSGVFIRCIFSLCSYVAEALEKKDYENKVTLRIDDLDLPTLELLLNAANEFSSDTTVVAKYKQGMEKIKQCFMCPVSLLHYLNGFYFNSSRSSISRDYNFFASYKYLFLCLNYMEDNKLTFETFDREKFFKAFKNIDGTWFSS
ncbi:hypothetical protein FOA43_003808 [Brettanomyces nanus]|uniref:Zn(2)-C6 fungal-type domain-containing protein n=1 Tax=Eeniella nana TaxID=13502 RepID=A0A875S9Z9_EENNA|nr:uncharacterized protein FOA43_003808 [Brettanomyces nanus]QPG76419.1 hypothetical protein FOA43_003808 [Brettanomyces nanus]